MRFRRWNAIFACLHGPLHPMGAHVPGMKRAAPPRLARILKERTARFRVRCQMSGPKCLPDSPASIHMPRDSCVTLRMCVLLCFPHAATARQDALHFWLPTTPGNMRCLICCLLTLSAVAAAQQPLEPLVKFRAPFLRVLPAVHMHLHRRLGLQGQSHRKTEDG